MVGKTLELFLSQQFIPVKWRVSRTVDSTQTARFLYCFDTLAARQSVLAPSYCVCYFKVVFHLCHQESPWITMCRSGCGARPAAALLIRAQVSNSQHIRVRLQPIQDKLHGGLTKERRRMCAAACSPNETQTEYLLLKILLVCFLNLLQLENLNPSSAFPYGLRVMWNISIQIFFNRQSG